MILKFSGKVLSQKPLIDLNLLLEIRPQIRLHFDIWQNHYNIVKFKNKIKLKKEIRPQIIKWRKFWRATVHGVARVGHDLATKSPPPKF